MMIVEMMIVVALSEAQPVLAVRWRRRSRQTERNQAQSILRKTKTAKQNCRHMLIRSLDRPIPNFRPIESIRTRKKTGSISAFN